MHKFTSVVLTLFPILLACPLQAQRLDGAIDIHIHAAPDSVPRSIDAIDLAKAAREHGMRAIVLKNHYEPTSTDAYLVHKVVPEIEVYGGVDLNLSMGGMNPAAVEKMALTAGGLGRFVWMATYDTQAQVKFSKENRPFVAVSKDGQLLPETKAVLNQIAKYHLIMATGHNSPEEDLMLIRESRSLGITQMVVTHAMMPPILMSIDQMKEAASMGAYIEFVYNGLIGKSKRYEMADYARAIRAVGVKHCIISSDLGQVGNPLPPDGLAAFAAGLKKSGFSEDEIEQMSARNPSDLLANTGANVPDANSKR